jgi:formylglycine-generating enzyme required for sulfatase activity/CheY-like chemotaxis protein
MRILLVDDDSAVIQALLAVLKTLPGHEIRVGLSGHKALENAASMGGVDLLITDVVMEPMDGFSLREELRVTNPALRTIFISGYDLSDYPEQIGGHQVLAKPVDASTLIAAIEAEGSQPAATEDPAEPISSPPVPQVLPVARASSPSLVEPAVSAAPVEAAQPYVATAAADNGEAEAPVAIMPEQFQFQIPTGAADPESESLIGQTIGAYQILSELGEGRWGRVYAGVQLSINRPVGLKILDASRQKDPTAKARFIADARAKAHVQHPSILSVYEAGESEGRIFYAHEFVDGQNLAELQASGQKLEESVALKVMRTVAEGLLYLATHTIPHTTLTASSIYLGVDGHVRLANLATEFAEANLTPEHQIQVLGRVMLGVLPAAQTLSPGLRALLGRMVQSGPNALTAWGALLQGLKALEPKVVPVEAAKISAQDRAAIAAVEAARRQQKKSLWLTVGSMVATLLVVGVVVYIYIFRSNERFLEAQVAIPAGQYIVGAGEKVTLDAFWIDKYEVTIGQYARFLAYLAAHPTAEAEFNHPRQPRHLSHEPPNWEIYYGRAAAGKPVRSVPIDLNSPMLEVTWWDAYAYAKWLGRELPTEAQWEAAGRGPKGLLYPWGDEADPTKANSGADHAPNEPEKTGEVDGFNFWNQVDKMKNDQSSFGVIGMAGNVSEWTATWTPDNRFPIVKGGNFSTPDVRLDRRLSPKDPKEEGIDPGKVEDFIGFRTISKTPPK